jgi:hypothetical protein
MSLRAFLASALCAIGFAALPALAGLDGIRTIPQTPVAGSDFVIEISGSTPGSPSRVDAISTSAAGQLITVQIRVSDGGFSVPGALRATQTVNLATPGTYQLTVQWNYAGTSGVEIGVHTITVAPAGGVDPQFRGLGGLWWAPDEPGWALAVTQPESGRLFAMWFTYAPLVLAAPSGPAPQTAATWYMLPSGTWVSPTAFSGQLYTAVGPPANLSFDPASVAVNRVGTATIRVLSADRLEFEAEAANGVTKRKTLQRFIF